MKPTKKWQAYLLKHLDTDVDQDMFTTKPRLGGRVWSKATTVGKLATKPNTATFHYWRRQPARHMYSQVSTNLQLTETITATHSSCSTCWKHIWYHRLNWSGWVSSLWPLNNYVQIVETYSSPLISRLEVVQDGNLRPPQNLFNLAWSAVLVP